ncbi:MAG: chain-length determining protein [Alloprevotella sp.]|nr:chain-length determining protein [Alloprevotella sp.]
MSQKASRNTLQASFTGKIRLDVIVSTLFRHRRKYILPLSLTIVLTSAIMLCIPRYYQVQVKLAPEYTNGGGSLGGLSSMASMIGINLNSMNSNDAITPMFYPDVINSTDFLVPLMDVHVQTADGSFSGRYVDYLTKHQDAPFWTWAMIKVKAMLKKPGTLNTDKDYRPDPFRLTEMEDKVVRGIGGSIRCAVDKKTDVITLTTTAQDPLVAACMADTVMARLQDFITEYRTKKARIDLDHINILCNDAHEKYLKACTAYADFVDSHPDVVLQSYKNRQDQLENEMQMAFTAYNSLAQQRILAESKLQERTPAFTVLQNASVPVKHAGPKRMFNVAALTILVFIITSINILVRTREDEEQKDGKAKDDNGGDNGATVTVAD